MAKQLDDAVATGIVHALDRQTEFFVKAMAARLVWRNEYADLLRLDQEIQTFWNMRGFSDEIMRERGLMSNAWDLLQCNFCYNRPAAVVHEDMIERRFDTFLRQFLAQFAHRFKRLTFPALDHLRAADLRCPLDLPAMIRAADGLFNNDQFRQFSSSSRTISQELGQSIFLLLHRYPIFLSSAARFFFFSPADVGMKVAGNALAFGASYDIGAEEFVAALDDYKFNFLMTRAYFAPNAETSRADSDWKMMDQLATTYVGKEARRNKYISQKNSIVVSLCAMHAWDLVHHHQMVLPSAINRAAEMFTTSNADSRYKKVKDRYRAIDRFITEAVERYRPREKT